MRRDTTPPYLPSSGDPLACLGERDGWREAEGGGWTNPALGITVKQGVGLRAFTIVDRGGNKRTATSATGALCIVDAIARESA